MLMRLLGLSPLVWVRRCHSPRFFRVFEKMLYSVILKTLVAVYLSLTEIKVCHFFLTLSDVPINDVAVATVF